MSRSSGILCHPTSLPGPFGIGTLGRDARRFVDVLSEMSQTWWQMLPIGPTGYGDSPYQSPSTFAGNPLLIDLEDLCRRGLLDQARLEDRPPFPEGHVDFGAVIGWQTNIVSDVVSQFSDRASDQDRRGLAKFRQNHADIWLDDFSLFMALKRANGLRPWWKWEDDLASKRPEATRKARRDLGPAVTAVSVEQYLFDTQFTALRRRATRRGIKLIGDIPIFVAHDSADVWANRQLFHLDDAGMPTVVAGVPPDYFSETGQRWGNPLYNWAAHRSEGFEWWTSRLKRVFDLFDLVRVDHFRGFAAAWHIPADQPTAIKGTWVAAPGEELFDHLSSVFGDLNVIAEDLGVITPDVEALRDRYGFPGMKILQFGFGTESAHAIDQFRENVVAYTGTHDNDTARGWWDDQDADRVEERFAAAKTLATTADDFGWSLIEAVAQSVADTSVFPLQDLLGLGSDARMNLPGTTESNWRWRFTWDQLSEDVMKRMRHITAATNRVPHGPATFDGAAGLASEM